MAITRKLAFNAFSPLSVFCYCGIAGVFIDVDHIPYFLGFSEVSRPAHTIILIIAGIASIFVITYLGRLYLECFLITKRLRKK